MVDAMGRGEGAFALGVSGWLGRHTLALKLPGRSEGVRVRHIGGPTRRRWGRLRARRTQAGTLRNARERCGDDDASHGSSSRGRHAAAGGRLRVRGTLRNA